MAVKTKISNKNLQKLVSEYNIGEFVKSKPFKTCYVQTNILINTKKGKYVLRYYENRSKKSVSFEAELLLYLKKHNYPCAIPIKDKKGKVINLFKKKPFIIFSYLKARHLKKINDKQLYHMIKQLALLHKITKGYKPVNYKHREPRTKKFCLEAAKIESRRFKNKERGKIRLNRIKIKLKELTLPNNLPKGVIHGDFDKANIKFKGNKITGILDFDDSTYTFLIYDLGVVLLYWTRFYLKKFNFKRARKIINIYEKYRPLTDIEKIHIYDALQFSALMIMSWLIYDKWKGKDLFKILSRILDELDSIGRNEFYKKIFD
jgi:homoserine kinase type II